MAKLKYAEGASAKDKHAFAKYLSEDEELIVVTGYGSTFIRQKFIYYMMLPGFIAFLIGLAATYFYQINLSYGLLIGLIGCIILAFIKTIWFYHAHRYLLTTRRLIVKNGLFAVRLTSALYDKITHIEVDQSLMDRMIMHHGTVIVHTAGMSKDEINVEFIEGPIEFKNILERLINREREQFGKGTGPVVTLEGELVE